MMNPPSLWYMCKYCMTPFYNLADLNIHKQWFHPHSHSLPEQSNLCSSQVEQFSKANALCGTTTDDKKFKQNNVTHKHDYVRGNDKGNMKLEEKNKTDVGQYYLKPEIGIKRDESFHGSNHHAHSSTSEYPGLGLANKSDYQNYSALSFDLSMLKSKSEIVESLPISELDAFFSKEQINQVACHRNLNPNSKFNSSNEHNLNVPAAPPKKEKKKRLPKNYSQSIPALPINEISPKPAQKGKRKSGGNKSRKPIESLNCCFCGEKFDDIEKLKIHELDEGLHFGARSSRSSSERQSNQTIPVPVYGLPVPGENNMYKCRYCSKQVAHRWSLIRHERKHTGEKRFRCQYCQKPIDDKCALAIHERTHTGERPYKCGTCEATFARRSSTKRHELAHIGIKPKSYPRRRR